MPPVLRFANTQGVARDVLLHDHNWHHPSIRFLSVVADCTQMLISERQEFRKSRPNIQNAKNDELSVLMGYDHFSAAALMCSGDLRPASKGSVEGSDDNCRVGIENKNEGSEEEADYFQTEAGMADCWGSRESTDQQELFVADDILSSVIRQGEGLVSFIFQKFD